MTTEPTPRQLTPHICPRCSARTLLYEKMQFDAEEVSVLAEDGQTGLWSLEAGYPPHDCDAYRRGRA